MAPSVNLVAVNCHLVAQHDDLDGELAVTATDEADDLEDVAERSVEEREATAGSSPRRGSGVKVLAQAMDGVLGTDRVVLAYARG